MNKKALVFFKDKSSNSQVFYNFLGTVLRSGINFFTMPIFTRLLGAEQYGKYSVYNSWLSILICLMGANVSAGIGTAYYKYKNKYYEYRSSSLVEGTAFSIVLAIILFSFYIFFNKILHFEIYIFTLLIADAFAHFVLNFANLSWIYEKNAKRNMYLSVLNLLATTILSVICLFCWWGEKQNLYFARIYGTAIPQIILALLIWFFMFYKRPKFYVKEYWKHGIEFGIPMLFHLLSQQILGQSDRVMMDMFNVSEAEIGIYSFFYSFCAIMSTILSALNNSWCPFLYDDLSKQNYTILIGKVKNYVKIFSVLAAGFLMISREVIKIFADEEYWLGTYLVPILVLVIYFTFIYQFAVNYEIFNSKPKYVAFGTIGAALMNICLNKIMIPGYGMIGAAIATLISYIALAIIHFSIVFNWKLKPYPIGIKYNIEGLLFCIFFCFLYYVLCDAFIVRWIIGTGLAFYLFIGIYRRKTIF